MGWSGSGQGVVEEGLGKNRGFVGEWLVGEMRGVKRMFTGFCESGH